VCVQVCVCVFVCHVYQFVCMCVYNYMCILLYAEKGRDEMSSRPTILIFLYMCTHAYTPFRVRRDVCLLGCMRECTYIDKYKYVGGWVCKYIPVHVFVCALSLSLSLGVCVCVCTCVCLYVLVCARAHGRVWLPWRSLMCVFVCVHVCLCVCMCVCVVYMCVCVCEVTLGDTPPPGTHTCPGDL
jgi:hypothetical protein